MFRLKRLARNLSLLLSLTLVLAPVVPAFAFVSHAADTHAVHAFHDSDQASAEVHADPKESPCAQHDSCNGQCCASCAQCSGAVLLAPSVHLPSHPVQTPVLNQLHPFFLATSPDRPPRRFSL